MPTSRISFPVLAAIGFVTAAAMVCTPPFAYAQTATSAGAVGADLRAPGMPGAPPRDTSARGPAPAVGTGVVRGRIVAGDTGLPLRRARVMLHALGGGEPRVTLSDGEARSRSTPSPRGVTRARLEGALRRRQAGRAATGRPGPAVRVADGQTFDSVVLTLAAAGVITGRVLDDFGDIVPGVDGDDDALPHDQRRAPADVDGAERGTPPTTPERFGWNGLPPGTCTTSPRVPRKCTA